MFELEAKEFYKASHLFDRSEHNIPVIFSVIEGNIPGKLYVDDIDNPQSAFLYPKDSFFYVAGASDNSKFNGELYEMIFEDILKSSNEGELVLFSVSEGWRITLDELLKDKAAIKIARKTFTFNQSMYLGNRINPGEKLTHGYQLVPLNHEIAKKIEVTKSWRTVEDFLDKGIGYAILKGNDLVSACYSIYLGKGEAEVDIFTDEKYRGMGLAKITATAFIDGCISKKIKPSWSCWPFREASYNLAKSIGFQEKQDVQAHYWSPSM